VAEIEEGEFPSLFVAYLFGPCYHCGAPVCLNVCPINAITKREEDGIVVVDRDLCLGEDVCGSCKESCPFYALQFGDEENAKVQKCDFCLGRWHEKKKPICVEACPMRALDAGPLDELRAKYGDIREAAGFAHFSGAKPSITFKKKNRPT
jgi:anaerobic dimethyl sulfoxide reductase subunit B (iron-sulfur subunit)